MRNIALYRQQDLKKEFVILYSDQFYCNFFFLSHFKKNKVDNKKKIDAVIWLFAQIAEYLNEGKINIRDARSKSKFLFIELNLVFRFK